MIPVLILAAGQSSRMGGRDKLAEPVDGVPLLTQQVRRASATGAKVFVALTSRDHPRASLIEAATPLVCADAASGMADTLRNAVAALPDCAAFMMVLGDLAALDTADLEAVHAAYLANPDALIWRGATEDGKAGHPVIFNASLRPAFADLHGDNGGEVIVKPLGDRTVLVPLPENRARLDLDTPADWAEFRARTGR